MNNETLAKVRESLTPQVTITAAHDLPDGGISLEIRHEYSDVAWSFPIAKLIYVRADHEGNIMETKELF